MKLVAELFWFHELIVNPVAFWVEEGRKMIRGGLDKGQVKYIYSEYPELFMSTDPRAQHSNRNAHTNFCFSCNLTCIHTYLQIT